MSSLKSRSSSGHMWSRLRRFLPFLFSDLHFLSFVSIADALLLSISALIELTCVFIFYLFCLHASGALRKNLDPFDECDDAQIWQALEDVCLKKVDPFFLIPDSSFFSSSSFYSSDVEAVCAGC